MKRGRAIAVALVFLLLPLGARAAWFYRGIYSPQGIPPVSEFEVSPPTRTYQEASEQVSKRPSRILVDLSHQNNLNADDLSPLLTRLSESGAAIDRYETGDGSLSENLRGTSALLVVAPTTKYSPEEIETVQGFVDDGGRLLLVADPTRPVKLDEEDDERDLASILFPRSAVPAINSLANVFGIVYFDDYLYNLKVNHGNYRNVRFEDFEANHPLTDGLSRAVFFAAHSLQTDGLALAVAGQDTQSIRRSGEELLTAAGLDPSGQVLALGDLTMFAPGFRTVADNDRFLTNVANWLVSAQRDLDLSDAPHFFRDSVDLIQITGEQLDPRLMARFSALKEAFRQVGVTLEIQERLVPEHDALVVGTFGSAEDVEAHLDAAAVRVEASSESQTQAVGDEEPAHTILVDGLGSMESRGLALFVLNRQEARSVLVVLAEDGDLAVSSLQRVRTGNFSGCVTQGSVAVCSSDRSDTDLGLEEEADPKGDGETSRQSNPSLASVTESEDAFQAGVPTLQELAPEEYPENSQAGETYTYTVGMSESQDVIWMYGWCASSKEVLDQNWEHIQLAFSLNGQRVSLSRFVRLDGSAGETACRLHYVLVTDWPNGDHRLSTEVTFEQPIDDGFDQYPAGTHVFEYMVQVDVD